MHYRLVFPALFVLVVGCTSSTPETSTPSPAVTTEIRKKVEAPAEPDSQSVAKSSSSETVAEPGSWGSLKGRFVFDGTPPKQVRLSPDKDVHVCGKHELYNESLVVNPENQGIQNVVVSLYTKRGQTPPIHESYESSASDQVTLDNEMCRFNNHITFLRTTQTLLVRNLDGVGHNTKIDAQSNASINPILPANGDLEHQFEKVERNPVAVSCSIHPWMNGYVLVKDHPYVAVTDENGEFELKNLPSGNWTFHVWQEKAKTIEEVQLGGDKTAWKRGRFDQAVAEGVTDLGEILVSPDQFE